MLGFGPLSSAPISATTGDLPLAILAEKGFWLYEDAPIIRYSTNWSMGELVYFSGDVEFVTSISNEGLTRISLDGTTEQLVQGYRMITNFEMTAGDSRVVIVTVRDRNGLPINIVDASIRWRATKSFGKTASISKDTDSAGVLIVDGANGQFTINLDPEDTEDLTGSFYHEAELTATDDSVSTILTGTMRVRRQVIEAT